MDRRRKPKFVTLQEFPSVGPFRVRILRDLGTRSRIFDVRQVLPTGELSRYGIRIWNRADLHLLSNVIQAVLRDPTLF